VSPHLAVLAAYSGLLIAVGWYVSRRARSAEGFFVAGRRLPARLIFATVLAANIGAGSTIGAAALGYEHGLAAFWWVGAAGLGTLLLACWLGPRMWRVASEARLRTVGDFLELRYGAGVRVARKRRLPLFTLLRALGYDEERHPGFLDRFVEHFDFLAEQWEKQGHLAPTRDESLIEIYKRVRPGDPATAETARSYFENSFFSGRRYDLSRVGRHKLNRKLGPEFDFLEQAFGLEIERPDPDQPLLSPCEMLAAATYLLNLAKGVPGYRLDDQDHFANRRIRSVGELIQNQVRIGL